jgi:hypothetical protein
MSRIKDDPIQPMNAVLYQEALESLQKGKNLVFDLTYIDLLDINALRQAIIENSRLKKEVVE